MKVGSEMSALLTVLYLRFVVLVLRRRWRGGGCWEVEVEGVGLEAELVVGGSIWGEEGRGVGGVVVVVVEGGLGSVVGREVVVLLFEEVGGWEGRRGGGWCC